MTDAQLAAVAPGCICTPGQLDRLEDWVGRHYRQRLVPADLADPRLLEESRGALAELTKILGIGRVYRFQGR
jgi:succinylarginine dihydrolase